MYVTSLWVICVENNIMKKIKLEISIQGITYPVFVIMVKDESEAHNLAIIHFSEKKIESKYYIKAETNQLAHNDYIIYDCYPSDFPGGYPVEDHYYGARRKK